MPSATIPPSATTNPHPDIPPFPSPSTFAILPDIYLLLTRLDLLQQSQSQSTQTASSSTTFQPSTPGGTALPPISAKDLPTLTHPIKQKLAKARAVVLALPDVERGVDAQEAEIRMLEVRIAALRERLGELGSIAGQRSAVVGAKKETKDVVMSGVEDED